MTEPPPGLSDAEAAARGMDPDGLFILPTAWMVALFDYLRRLEVERLERGSFW